MTPTQLRITELIGSDNKVVHVIGSKKPAVKYIGSPATIMDLHRWMIDNVFDWWHNRNWIHIKDIDGFTQRKIEYDSSIPLMNQSPETLEAIKELLESHQS